MLRCESLKKEFYYGNSIQSVLRKVDLSVKKGEIITIMGKSVNGKTTLLNCLSLLESPDDGKIYYEDKLIDFNDTKNLEKFRRENIGYVFQNPNLIPCLNVVENLIIAIHEKQSYAKKRRKALEMLGLLGMVNKEKQSISTMSGGELQRVSILRALINNPKIIFCDEPTGALDEENSNNVMSILIKLTKMYNTTLVIVTHDQNVAKVGDNQYVMREGKLYESE